MGDTIIQVFFCCFLQHKLLSGEQVTQAFNVEGKLYNVKCPVQIKTEIRITRSAHCYGGLEWVFVSPDLTSSLTTEFLLDPDL